jgi:hypothetical protein
VRCFLRCCVFSRLSLKIAASYTSALSLSQERRKLVTRSASLSSSPPLLVPSSHSLLPTIATLPLTIFTPLHNTLHIHSTPPNKPRTRYICPCLHRQCSTDRRNRKRKEKKDAQSDATPPPLRLFVPSSYFVFVLAWAELRRSRTALGVEGGGLFFSSSTFVS